jgi:hypothetical protein
MAICSSEPELKEARVRWIDVLLCFDFDAKPNLVVTGARWLGEFAYVSRSGVYPGSRVGWRLPETLFERSGLVELALRETGSVELEMRPWDRMEWSWTAVFNATTRDGRPFLEPVG